VADEVELKLELTAAAADALEQEGFFAAKPKIVQQRSVYFDTADNDLATAGLTLRIRTSGTSRVQTVKAGGGTSAGLFVRPEWEQPVEGDAPILDGSTPIRALLGDRADDLGPIFEVVVERRTWNLKEEGAAVEVVLDRGDVIVAGERQSSLCEIELELKSGPPTALFAIARRMNLAAPVRLGVLSKSERGYRLLGAVPRRLKAEPIDLHGSVHASTAFRKIARGCVRQFRLNEAILLDHADEEALHQARVALRRLRSALSMHKPFLMDDQFDHLRTELRWFVGVLGEARNLDVLIRRLRGSEITAALEERRQTAYAEVAETLASQRARDLMIDLSEWLAIGGWLSQGDGQDLRDLAAPVFAAQQFDRLRKRVKKQGRDLTLDDDEARHELRKSIKKLRYASEFYEGLFTSKREKRRHRQFAATLTDLQDQLGDLNDMAMMPQVLESLDLGGEAEASILTDQAGKASKVRLIQRASEAHDALMDTKRFWR
jgi:inorganic triphosphatase YgiF